nr:transglutaminase domain-containing protein [bacterium]
MKSRAARVLASLVAVAMLAACGRPAQTPLPGATPMGQPTPGHSPAPTQPLTPTPQATATPGLVPGPSPQATAAPSPAPSPTPVAGQSPTPASPTPQVTHTPRPTGTPPSTPRPVQTSAPPVVVNTPKPVHAGTPPAVAPTPTPKPVVTPTPTPKPVVTPPPSSEEILSNEKAQVDIGSLSGGIVRVRYTGGKNVRIKVRIQKSGGPVYTYDCNNAGNWEKLTVTEGSGSYTVQVFENTSGSKYAMAFSTNISVSLYSPFAPFLTSNKNINYSPSSACVAKAASLASGKSGDLAKIEAIYRFAVENITYDYNKAATVQSGYIPNLDSILAARTGICYDYAALVTAMLRSQGIPTQCVFGYTSTGAYHAWIRVYTASTGWICKVIFFDGKNWKLMDPTFASAGGQSDSIMEYINNPSNYSQSYVY